MNQSSTSASQTGKPGLVRDILRGSSPKMPIPLPRTGPGSRPSPSAVQDTGEPTEGPSRASHGIFGSLTGLVPQKDLAMASDSFRERFPDVDDPSSLTLSQLSGWLESLPLAHV